MAWQVAVKRISDSVVGTGEIPSVARWQLHDFSWKVPEAWAAEEKGAALQVLTEASEPRVAAAYPTSREADDESLPVPLETPPSPTAE